MKKILGKAFLNERKYFVREGEGRDPPQPGFIR